MAIFGKVLGYKKTRQHMQFRKTEQDERVLILPNETKQKVNTTKCLISLILNRSFDGLLISTLTLLT